MYSLLLQTYIDESDIDKPYHVGLQDGGEKRRHKKTTEVKIIAKFAGFNQVCLSTESS